MKEEENLEVDDVDNSNLSDVGDEEFPSATVDLMDNSGNSVGVAELTEEEEGVRVKVDVTGLPEGVHGFHFHEFGKCEAPDFESAGSHFNPTGADHGLDHEGGTSLVIHAEADDGKTQPSGNSGDRIACGIVEES